MAECLFFAITGDGFYHCISELRKLRKLRSTGSLGGLEVFSIGIELSFRSVELLLRGVELAFRGIELPLRDVELFSRGIELSFRGIEQGCSHCGLVLGPELAHSLVAFSRWRWIIVNLGCARHGWRWQLSG